MTYREIEIQDRGDHVEVDLFPDMFVEPEEFNVPTKMRPDILVTIGKVNGRDAPLHVKYPNRYGVPDVVEKADMLLDKREKCSLCEERKRRFFKRLEEQLGKQATERVVQRAKDIQSERKRQRAVIPPDAEPAHVPRPLQERLTENVEGAVREAHGAVVGLLTLPQRIWVPEPSGQGEM